jgi:hypothetical protein
MYKIKKWLWLLKFIIHRITLDLDTSGDLLRGSENPRGSQILKGALAVKKKYKTRPLNTSTYISGFCVCQIFSTIYRLIWIFIRATRQNQEDWRLRWHKCVFTWMYFSKYWELVSRAGLGRLYGVKLSHVPPHFQGSSNFSREQDY